MGLTGISKQLMNIDADVLASISKMKKSDFVKHINVAIAFIECNYDKVPLESVQLADKIITTLKNGGIKTLGDLTRALESDIKLIPGVGKAAIRDIQALISKLHT